MVMINLESNSSADFSKHEQPNQNFGHIFAIPRSREPLIDLAYFL